MISFAKIKIIDFGVDFEVHELRSFDAETFPKMFRVCCQICSLKYFKGLLEKNDVI